MSYLHLGLSARRPAMNIGALIRTLALLRMIAGSAAGMNAVNEGYERPGERLLHTG